MKLTLQRDELLQPLQMVNSVIEKRQTLPILSNVLLQVEDNQLSLTGTDLEIELVGRTQLSESQNTTRTTLPSRKLLDICRALPDDAILTVDINDAKQRATIQSGRSRFTLAILPTADFPTMKEATDETTLTLAQKDLKFLLQRTAFAMAQQDIRYYLNGLLFEINEGSIRTVATDGHRLALNSIAAPEVNNNFVQVIVPYKAVMELMRLLNDDDSEIQIAIGKNYIRTTNPLFTFTSKLVDGRYPDYEKILPKGGDKAVVINRETLKQALNRASILSNEKSRGIRLQLRNNQMNIQANNPEQEEAQEELHIEYNNGDLDIGFNVNYLLDVLSNVDTDDIMLTMANQDSSILAQEHNSQNDSLFVIMPMRL